MTPHFSKAELACKCGCGALPSQRFADKCERVRMRVGFPLPVSSCKRCPDHNEKVSKTGRTGPHTKDAIDFLVHGALAFRVLEAIIAEDFAGIGVSQKGPITKRFIHGDDLPDELWQPRPWVWSY